MGKEFEIRHDITTDATPEQIWDTIATGPGISSWFIGRTDIDGDTVRTSFGEATMPTGTITAADPPHHFAYRTGDTNRHMAHEYLIEGQAGSATVLRTVTSGFLPGDDWADEYEAMGYGTELFLATLAQALHHFPGRTATPVVTFGPTITDWPTTWANLHAELGLGPAPRAGDPTPGGGHVYLTNPHTLGIRTPGALHRYLRGFHGPLIAAHEIFAGDTDPRPWTELLTRVSPTN